MEIMYPVTGKVFLNIMLMSLCDITAAQTIPEKDKKKSASYIHTEVDNIPVNKNAVTSTALESPISKYISLYL